MDVHATGALLIMQVQRRRRELGPHPPHLLPLWSGTSELEGLHAECKVFPLVFQSLLQTFLTATEGLDLLVRSLQTLAQFGNHRTRVTDVGMHFLVGFSHANLSNHRKRIRLAGVIYPTISLVNDSLS